MQTTTTIILTERFGATVLLTLVGGIGLLCGWAIRTGLKRSGGISRTATIIAFAVPVLALTSLTLVSSLGGFSEVRLNERDVRLRGLLPWQETTVQRSQIGEVVVEPDFKSTWRIALTVDGRAHRSMRTSRERVDAVADALGGVRATSARGR